MKIIDDPKQYSDEESSDLFREISRKFFDIEKHDDLEIPKSLLTYKSINHKNRTLLHMLANTTGSIDLIGNVIVVTIAFAYLRLKTRSIWPGVICHTMIDVAPLFLQF